MHATDPSSITQCETVEGLSVPSTSENLFGTIVASEASVCAEAIPGGASQFLAKDPEFQDLKQYLSRPTLLARGSVATSPQGLFNSAMSYSTISSFIPGFVDRLRGARGFRADLVFTIEHNANPFHQGLLVAGFQYGSGQFWRVLRPSMVTHVPHVRLDLATNTRAVLRVPYLSEFEYWGSSDSEIGLSMGLFALIQVLPTPTLTNSATPVWKLYLQLENVEVFGRVPVLTPSFIVPQSGVAATMPGRASVAEAELKANGSFSGVLRAAAALPAAVGSWMPSLAPFTGTATWFLNCASKAASAFGFSKPVDSSSVVRQIRYPNWCEGNIDIAAPSAAVGAFLGNSVSISPALGGTDLDEMAFDTILTRYSQIFRGSMATTNSHGECLYASHVCLAHMWFRSPGVATNGGNISIPRGSTTQFAVIPSTLMYFGQNFRLWHGGFKYRVSFAKSKFHTGRVMFSFIPNYRQIPNTSRYFDAASEGGPVPAEFSLDLQPSQYTKVFDLKDDSVFEFEIPYIAPVSHLGYNDSMGFVSMQVLDPLINNGESAPSISFIVEVAALPGFYFAGISQPGQPVCADNVQPAIEFQSGVGASSRDASQFSVGEKFMSAKQLAMYPTWNRVDTANGALVSGTVPPWPSVASWGPGTTALAVDASKAFAFSRAGLVAQCYAYAVGSTLLTIDRAGFSAGSRVAVIQTRADNGLPPAASTVPSQYVARLTDPNLVCSRLSPVSGGGTYLLPMLCGGPRFRVGDFNTDTAARDFTMATNTYTTTSNTCKVLYNITVNNTSGATIIWNYATSAADDARCAAYIGPCPLVLANTGTTTSSWYTGAAF